MKRQCSCPNCEKSLFWRGLDTTYGPDRKKWYQLTKKALTPTKRCPFCDAILLEEKGLLGEVQLILFFIWMIYLLTFYGIENSTEGKSWQRWAAEIGFVIILTMFGLLD